MKSILIIGAGGHGKVAAEIAIENGYHVQFLDDTASEAIGTIDDFDKVITAFDACFVAIGNNNRRAEIQNTIIQKNAPVVSLIAKDAYVSNSAEIGRGVIIEHKAIVNTGSVIGDGSIVSIGVCIDHNVTIGNYVHLNVGSICKAGAVVPHEAKIDAARVIEGF